MSIVHTFKICLIGDARVGKSMYGNKLEGPLGMHMHVPLPPLVQEHIENNPQDERRLRTILGASKPGMYTPTLGCEIYNVRINTNIGPIQIWLQEISGSYRNGFQSYYQGAKAVIVLSTESTMQNIQTYLQEANMYAPLARKYNCYNVNGNVVIEGTDKDPMELVLRRLTNNNTLRII